MLTSKPHRNVSVHAESTRAARHESDLELARAALPAGLFQLEAFALADPDHLE